MGVPPLALEQLHLKDGFSQESVLKAAKVVPKAILVN
jgi:hypothetical protein